MLIDGVDYTPEVEQLTANEELLAEDQLEQDGGNGETDEAKDAHDKAVVSSVHKEALDTATRMGLVIHSAEQREALGLFPKVGSLYFRHTPALILI